MTNDMDRLVSRAITLAIELEIHGGLPKRAFNRFVSLCDALGVSEDEMRECARESLAEVLA